MTVCAESRLPVVYFTDGQDYSDPRMGRATIVLDNRIAGGALRHWRAWIDDGLAYLLAP